MPQGTIIAIKPIGSKGKDKPGDGCEGEIEILDGPDAGEVGSFKQNDKCCEKRVGEEVEIEIISKDSGKIKVKMKNCG